MNFTFLFLLEILVMLCRFNYLMGNVVPVISPLNGKKADGNRSVEERTMRYLPFIMMVDKSKDTSEFWRETEILSLVRDNLEHAALQQCRAGDRRSVLVRFPSRRTVRPICRGPIEPIVRQTEAPCHCDSYPLKTFKVKNRTYGHRHACPCFAKRRFIFQTTRRRKNKKMVPATIGLEDSRNFYRWNYMGTGCRNYYITWKAL